MIHLFDTVKEIFHYLRQYKARTFMTLFGLTWGTVSIIVLLAFGESVKRAMSKNMHGMGEGIAILWPGRTSLPFLGFGRDRYIRFQPEDAELLRHEIREIAVITGEYSQWNANIRFKDLVNKPNISGVNPEYSPMRNIMPQPGGRWIDDLDMKERRRVVFLGNELAKYLFGEGTNPVGQFVYIGDSPFQVIGVLVKKTQPSSYSARDQDRAFIPSTTFASFFGFRYINNIVYQVADSRTAAHVQDRVFEVLGREYHFDPKDRQALSIWDTTEMDKFIYYFSMGLTLFLALIGIMTLTVGGIGLANIMYVVVQERTFEIGIRRSTGAKRRHIMSQFLLEALMIIAIGALAGFILSLAIIQLVRMLPFEEYFGRPELSLTVAAVSVLVLGSIGLLAGFFPARKAARLKVIDCLRY